MKKNISKNVAASDIVIGNTVEAVLYAYANEYVLISNNFQPPSPFAFFEQSEDISVLNIDPIEISLNSTDFVEELGHPKLDVWKRISYLLSLAGLLPAFDGVSSLRVEDNILKVFIGKSSIFKFEFERLHMFDAKGIEGIETINPDDQLYRVEDWINVRSGQKHHLDYLKFEEDFVKEIYFYPTERIDGNHLDKKDLVAISYLTEKQLYDINYSESYVKLLTKRRMTEAGIKGAKNGKNPNYPDRSKAPFKYLSVKLEHAERKTFKTRPTKPASSDNIFFVDKTARELMMEIKDKNNLKYLYNISKKIRAKDLLIR